MTINNIKMLADTRTTVNKNYSQRHINFSADYLSLTTKRGDRMANNLYQEISTAKAGDEHAMLRLLEIFSPLIRRYSHSLGYSDAYSDLLIALLELIGAIDLSGMSSHEDKYFVSYIQNSIYHSFILLSKKFKHDSMISPVASLDMDGEKSSFSQLENLLSKSDDYLQIEFEFLFSNLTDYEAKIIIFFFYYRYSVKEIAAIFHVSLPAITQAKKNALKKLKKTLELDGK